MYKFLFISFSHCSFLSLKLLHIVTVINLEIIIYIILYLYYNNKI